MHKILWKWKWNAIHDHIASKTQHPTQTITKNSSIFKNPKISKKIKNLGLNAWRMKDLEHLPRDLILDKAEKHLGKEFRVRRECLEGEKSFSVDREWEKWNLILSWTYLKKSYLDGSRIYQALNLDRYESVEALSRICWRQNQLDGSNFRWEFIGWIETFSMDREAIKTNSK